ncbi:hypothetical protein D9M68_501890 [compost metagenome]
MKLSEHKELKTEILRLSQKEKDRLLLRLIAKDRVLTERLHFLLREDSGALAERQEALKAIIIQSGKDLKKEKYSARNLLINLRKGLQRINHFYKVTKASPEEAELRLFLFNHLLEGLKVNRTFFKTKDDLSLENFVIKSTLLTIRKIEKLHSDWQFDMQEELNKLLQQIHQSHMAAAACAMGLAK